MEIDTVTTPQAKPQKQSIPKAKHWAGCTLNNYTPVDEAIFVTGIQPIADYYVYGKEVGESGTPHLQFMICFKTQKALTALKKIFPTAHWEIKSSSSTMLRASNYCKKGQQSKLEWSIDHEDGITYGWKANFVEYGTLPEDQHKAGLKVIKDMYEDTIEKAKAGKIDAIIPEHQLRYYKTVKQIAHDNKAMPNDLHWKDGDQPNIWIHGDTGMRRIKGSATFDPHQDSLLYLRCW